MITRNRKLHVIELRVNLRLPVIIIKKTEISKTLSYYQDKILVPQPADIDSEVLQWVLIRVEHRVRI